MLLQIAERPGGASAPTRRELIETAFERAGAARQAYPLKPVPIGWADTMAAMVGAASKMQVDRLSLQSRAVRAMLRLDRRKARELMEMVPAPDLASSKCSDDVLPNLRFYYETVGAVAESAFTTADVKKGDQERFLIGRLRDSKSAEQIFESVKLLADISVNADLLKIAVEVLASTVSAAATDDRSFSSELAHEPRYDRVGQLLRKCEPLGCASSVLTAFASYYRKQLSQRRCADTFLDKAHREQRQVALKIFNERFARASLQLTALAESSVDNVVLEDGAKIFDYYTGIPEYRELALRSIRLTQVPGRPPIDKTTTAFSDEVIAVLGQLEQWKKPDKISARDFFLIKSRVYASLTAAVVGTPLRQRVVRSLISFLEVNGTQRQDFPAEWLRVMSELLAGGLSARSPQSDNEKIEWMRSITEELDRTQDPVLSLYSRLHQFLSR